MIEVLMNMILFAYEIYNAKMVIFDFWGRFRNGSDVDEYGLPDDIWAFDGLPVI